MAAACHDLGPTKWFGRASLLTLNIVLMGTLAGFTILLGLPVARLNTQNKRVKGLLNAIAVGILLFLFIEVVQKGWHSVEDHFTHAYNEEGGYGPALGSLALFSAGLGIGLLSLVWYENRFVYRPATRNPAHTQSQASRSLSLHHLQAPTAGTPSAATPMAPAVASTSLALMIAVGIGLHNFSEGLAIGSSAASGALKFALLLAIGFALHNATEGFGIAAPLAGRKPTWGFLALAGLLAGAPTLFGTLLGALFASTLLSELFLALAAGSLLYVIKELLHHGRKLNAFRDNVETMTAVALGLLLGLGTDLIVTLAGA